MNDKIIQLEKLVGCCCDGDCDDSEIFDEGAELEKNELDELMALDGIENALGKDDENEGI